VLAVLASFLPNVQRDKALAVSRKVRLPCTLHPRAPGVRRGGGDAVAVDLPRRGRRRAGARRRGVRAQVLVDALRHEALSDIDHVRPTPGPPRARGRGGGVAESERATRGRASAVRSSER